MRMRYARVPSLLLRGCPVIKYVGWWLAVSLSWENCFSENERANLHGKKGKSIDPKPFRDKSQHPTSTNEMLLLHVPKPSHSAWHSFAFGLAGFKKKLVSKFLRTFSCSFCAHSWEWWESIRSIHIIMRVFIHDGYNGSMHCACMYLYSHVYRTCNVLVWI